MGVNVTQTIGGETGEMYSRRAVSPQIGNGMVFNLCGFYSNLVPVTRYIRVIDVSPLDFVWTESWPPDVLGGFCESQSHRLGNHRCA